MLNSWPGRKLNMEREIEKINKKYKKYTKVNLG
jgi:hypothetical protein